ncbi:hypothetical protein QE152_g38417 [Popillia japonica]|uniref:Uncharacterized protein n=1 Tax=Popillia japonica TaxID=7064 RepID=A0AAW1HWQ9_POPJA
MPKTQSAEGESDNNIKNMLESVMNKLDQVLLCQGTFENRLFQLEERLNKIGSPSGQAAHTSTVPHVVPTIANVVQTSSPKRQRIQCVCDQPGPATKRCPLHEIVEIGDENTLPDAAIEHISNGCICYEPGPARRMCPLHEMDAIDVNQESAIGIQNLIAANRTDIEQHSCGQLDQICPHCTAHLFANERNARRMYNKCCAGGNVILAALHQHPIELRRPLPDNIPFSRQFKGKIIAYNNCFQSASIQSNLRHIPGNGPYVYAIQGQIYHHYSDVNVNRDRENYSSIYYLDPEEAIRQRIDNARESM